MANPLAFSIGVDIVHVPRFASLFTRRSPHLLASRILTAREQTEWRRLMNALKSAAINPFTSTRRPSPGWLSPESQRTGLSNDHPAIRSSVTTNSPSRSTGESEPLQSNITTHGGNATALIRRVTGLQGEESFFLPHYKVHSSKNVLSIPLDPPQPEIVNFFASRWAAKEAAYKATSGALTREIYGDQTNISTQKRQRLMWKNFEVMHENADTSGKPGLKVVSDSTGKVWGEGKLSIAHDGEYVIAMVAVADSFKS